MTDGSPRCCTQRQASQPAAAPWLVQRCGKRLGMVRGRVVFEAESVYGKTLELRIPEHQWHRPI